MPILLRRVWTETDLDELRSARAEVAATPLCKIEVTGEHSISACLRVAEEEKEATIACLNFASAKNVCGGMLGGSLAQEESLGIGLHHIVHSLITAMVYDL